LSYRGVKFFEFKGVTLVEAEGLRKRTIASQSSQIFAANFVSGVSGLVALGIIARSSSLVELGLFSVLVSFCLAAEALASVQSWQAILYFGSKRNRVRRDSDYRDLLSAGFSLDVISLVVGIGAVVAGIQVIFIGSGSRADVVFLSLAAATPFVLSLSSTAGGVLRLNGRVQTISLHVAFGGLTYVAIAAMLSGLGISTLEGFFFAWVVGQVVTKAGIIWSAFRHEPMMKSGVISFWRGFRLLKKHAELRRFIIATMSNSSTRALLGLDTLLVGVVLGASAAGVYAVAKSVSKLVQKISTPVNQVLLPMFTRLEAEGNRSQVGPLAAWIGRIFGFGSLVFWVLFAIWGGHLIELLMGPGLDAAHIPALILLAGNVAGLFFFGQGAQLLSRGRAGSVAVINIAAAVIYGLFFMAFVTVTPDLGPALSITLVTIGVVAAQWVMLRK
jgi:O-antigen/teichoic acid export membrane protein